MTAKLILFFAIHFTIALGLAIHSGVVDASPSPKTLKCKAWRTIPLTPEYWREEYDIYKSVQYKNGIYLQPHTIGSSPGTHSALTLLNSAHMKTDFGVRLTYKNIRPLRTASANAWEVFWLFFNYRRTENHKQTNYFIFKTNGVELGKAWNETDQEFLQTTPKPQAEFGKTYELQIMKIGNEVQAFVDSKMTLHFRANSKQKLFEHEGQFGLYAEDAQVHVRKFELCDIL